MMSSDIIDETFTTYYQVANRVIYNNADFLNIHFWTHSFLCALGRGANFAEQ